MGSTQEIDFKKGSVIIDEKGHDRSMYIVKSGTVEVTKTKGLDKIILAVLGAGAYFGEMSFFDEQPRSATVIAIEDTKVIQIEFNDDMKKQLDTIPQWINIILKGVLSRLRQTSEKVKMLEEKVLINYKEHKGKYLSSHQMRELYRVLSLTELFLLKSNITSKFLDKKLLTDSVFECIPQVSLKIDVIIQFLLETKALIEEKDKEGKAILKIAGYNDVLLFCAFLKENLQTNENKIQVSSQELKIIEELVATGSALKKEDSPQKDVTILEDDLIKIMVEKHKDQKTHPAIKELTEKSIISKSADKAGKVTIQFSLETLSQSLPHLKMLDGFSTLIFQAIIN